MTITEEKFLNEILTLIESGREGSYWDFKQQWYAENKSSDLLYDIICMANNLENHDAYIIIGVRDDYTICGVNNDLNRKTTQNLTDFLRDKKFAGGFRPNVEVRHIAIKENELDIIRIEKSEFVPHYLEERYKEIFPYHIYTRVQDSNTPKNKSADLIHVEMLWKRHFHLLDSPLQKMKYFLHQKENWVYSESTETETKRYFKYAPEYTIKIQNIDGDVIETYMLTQLNKHSSWHKISLCYHQTILLISNGVLLDGGKFMTVEPDLGGFNYKSKRIYYYYFRKDSIKFALYKFLIHDKDSRDYYANQFFLEEVLLFKNEEERLEFEIYIYTHFDEYEKNLLSIKNTPNRKIIPQMQDEYDSRLALKKIQTELTLLKSNKN